MPCSQGYRATGTMCVACILACLAMLFLVGLQQLQVVVFGKDVVDSRNTASTPATNHGELQFFPTFESNRIDLNQVCTNLKTEDWPQAPHPAFGGCWLGNASEGLRSLSDSRKTCPQMQFGNLNQYLFHKTNKTARFLGSSRQYVKHSRYGYTFPAVVKVGSAHAGAGKMKIMDKALDCA